MLAQKLTMNNIHISRMNKIMNALLIIVQTDKHSILMNMLKIHMNAH